MGLEAKSIDRATIDTTACSSLIDTYGGATVAKLHDGTIDIDYIEVVKSEHECHRPRFHMVVGALMNCYLCESVTNQLQGLGSTLRQSGFYNEIWWHIRGYVTRWHGRR